MIFPDFLPIFFLLIFFLSKSFSCHPKTDFSSKNRPKNPIFCSLVMGGCESLVGSEVEPHYIDDEFCAENNILRPKILMGL